MGKLLFSKAVNKSLLKDGITISQKYCDDLIKALGVSLKRGERTDAIIKMGGVVYHATFTHVGLKTKDRDIYQIRYAKGSPICTALRSKYISVEAAAKNNAYIELWACDDKSLELKCFPTAATSVKEEFFNYLGTAESLDGYQNSYELVFYKCYFQEAMYEAEISADSMSKQFRQFYIDRKRAGLAPEYEGADAFVIDPKKGSVDDYCELILQGPFDEISKTGYFSKKSQNGKTYFAIQPELYAALGDDDLEYIRDLLYKKLDLYYAKDQSHTYKTEAEDGPESIAIMEANNPPTATYNLEEALGRFMNEYSEEKNNPMAGNNLAAFIRNGLPKTIFETGIVSEKEYKVSGGAGCGSWATIPWVCIFDRKVTVSAAEGVYIVYLLSKDTNRLYLTLNQGCTNLRKTHSKKETIQLMHENAKKIRQCIDAARFTPNDDIDLGEELNELGELYQKGTIFYREYVKGKLPNEMELRADLQSMVEIYSEYANPSKYPTPKEKAKRNPSGDRAWLLTWNPQNWNWNDYAAGLEASRFNEKYNVTWSCANSHVASGDRMYLMILGNNGVRGIIAAGKAISKVFEVPHWDYKKAAKGQKTNSVKVSFEKILDFRTDAVLKIETLQELFPEQKWNPQGSGIEIKEQYVDALKDLWDELISKQESGNIDELLSLLSSYTSGDKE